jgi:hypothetical protein
MISLKTKLHFSKEIDLDGFFCIPRGPPLSEITYTNLGGTALHYLSLIPYTKVRKKDNGIRLCLTKHCILEEVNVTLTKQSIRPVLIGLFLALITVAVLAFLSVERVIELTAMLLAVIAAVYICFALADGRESVKRVEVATAVLFIIVALVGLWLNPWFLVLGYIGHGVWDWLHHNDHIHADVVGWYPPLCAVYDWVLGIGLIFWII